MQRAVVRVLLATMFAIWAPAASSADALFSPWAAVIRGNEPAQGGHAFGWTASGMGGGIIGGEVDFGFSPDFFDKAVDNSALTVMGNLLIGIPIGGTTGVGLRPYVTGGAGLIRTQIDTPTGRDNASNMVGFNLGGGVMGFFSDHFGVRGDLRYFQNLTKGTNPNDLGPAKFGFDLGSLDFWRASIGIVIR
jgi:opacity protein-like surface antigen